MIGIYEITIKRISYDTGLSPEMVRKALKVFEDKSKVYYQDNYVILPNFLKNQNLNTNMQKGALNVYNNLPIWLKDKLSGKPLKAFESLRNAMLNVNRIGIEYESECEGDEAKPKKGFIIPSLNEVKVYIKKEKKGVSAAKFFNHYKANGWKIGANQMQDWKAAIDKWDEPDEIKPESKGTNLGGNPIPKDYGVPSPTATTIPNSLKNSMGNIGKG